MTNCSKNMNTDNNKVLKEKKYNSSIVGASVLLGVNPKVIEACLPMLQYINGLNDEKFEIWKEHGYRTEKRNAQSKETL